MPWPQSGDTEDMVQSVDTSQAVDYGGVDPTPIEKTIEYLLPVGDTTYEYTIDEQTGDTIDVEEQIDTAYVRWNSWDVPSPNSGPLDLSGNPARPPWTASNYLLTSCPFPLGSQDCTTGGSVSGRTYGAVRIRAELTPGIIITLDTLHYDAQVQLTLPAPGSFRPGDTITITADVQLDSAASFVGSVELDTATLVLEPFLRPFLSELSMRTCILGEFIGCVTRVRREPAAGDSLGGDPLTVASDFDPATLGPRGLQGNIRLPQLTFTDSRVEDGRRMIINGLDNFGSLVWDLDQFLCGGCLSGSLAISGASLQYTLLDQNLSTPLRMDVALTMEPVVTMSLDLDGVELEYTESDPEGTVLRTDTSSTITFAVGNSVGLIMSPAAGGQSGALTMLPSIAIALPEIEYDFGLISGPVSRGMRALSTRFAINPVDVGPVSFGGATFTLGPAVNSSFVSDSAVARPLSSNPDSLPSIPLTLDPFVLPLAPITFPLPQLPDVTTSVGPARPGLPLPGPAATPLAVHGEAATTADELSQTISVLNIGNVHLADFSLGYALRAAVSDELITEGEIATGDYLEMLETVDVEVPLDVERGREYRLGLTVRAETPIGTLTATDSEWTIGMYELDIQGPDDGFLPVLVYSSTELDARRIDPGSVLLAGLPPADWSWTTVEGLDALHLRFPLEETMAAARLLATGSELLALEETVQVMLGVGRSLSQAQLDVMDRQGNANGRLDVGDVRAFLEATGGLPTSGAGSGAPTDAPSSVPVRLLLTGQMDGDQQAYGLDVLLLAPEA